MSSRQKLRPVSSDEPATRPVSSQSLLDVAREWVIQHQGSEHHLRQTRNVKQILTK